MQTQKKPDAYLKEVLEDETDFSNRYFRIREFDGNGVNIIEVGDSGIILYDTRISAKAIEDKFNYMKMIQIKEEEFNKQIIEKLNKKD